MYNFLHASCILTIGLGLAASVERASPVPRALKWYNCCWCVIFSQQNQNPVKILFHFPIPDSFDIEDDVNYGAHKIDVKLSNFHYLLLRSLRSTFMDTLMDYMSYKLYAGLYADYKNHLPIHVLFHLLYFNTVESKGSTDCDLSVCEGPWTSSTLCHTIITVRGIRRLDTILHCFLSQPTLAQLHNSTWYMSTLIFISQNV